MLVADKWKDLHKKCCSFCFTTTSLTLPPHPHSDWVQTKKNSKERKIAELYPMQVFIFKNRCKCNERVSSFLVPPCYEDMGFFVSFLASFAGLKILIIAISNREFISSSIKGGKLELKMICNLQLLTTSFHFFLKNYAIFDGLALDSHFPPLTSLLQ